MTARGGNGFTRGQYPGPFYEPFIDGIAQTDIYAATSQVPYGGKTGVQRSFGIYNTLKGVIGRVEGESFEVAVGIGLMLQMHMAIDEARHYGLVFQVEHLVAIASFDIAPLYYGYLIGFHYDGIFFQDLSTGHVNQFPAVKNSTL
jgi:hypothetical protein